MCTSLDFDDANSKKDLRLPKTLKINPDWMALAVLMAGIWSTPSSFFNCAVFWDKAFFVYCYNLLNSNFQ